jgi:hypothetical protein
VVEPRWRPASDIHLQPEALDSDACCSPLREWARDGGVEGLPRGPLLVLWALILAPPPREAVSLRGVAGLAEGGQIHHDRRPAQVLRDDVVDREVVLGPTSPASVPVCLVDGFPHGWGHLVARSRHNASGDRLGRIDEVVRRRHGAHVIEGGSPQTGPSKVGCDAVDGSGCPERAHVWPKLLRAPDNRVRGDW